MIKFNIVLKKPFFELGVSFEAPDDSVVAIYGHSGAGKTTLLNALAGLEKKCRGTIEVKNIPWLNSDKRLFLPPQQRHVGYVFQDDRLFPHMNVQKNLLYGAGKYDKDIFDKITDILELRSLLKRKPDKLSGGEKKRVAVARALMSNPSVLLMDEPLTSLDYHKRIELLDRLKNLINELKIPVFYVTHDIEEILGMANYILVLENGHMRLRGGVEEAMASSDIQNIAGDGNIFNLMSGHISGNFPDHNVSTVKLDISETGLENHEIFIPLQMYRNIGDKVRLRILAKDIVLYRSWPTETSEINVLSGTIYRIDEQGDNDKYMLIGINIDDTLFWAELNNAAYLGLKPQIGEIIYLALRNISIYSL